MKYLLIALFSLLIAVTLGQLIADDAGFVVIGYGGKVLRTSFVFFVVLLIVGLTALYVVWRALAQIFGLRERWRGWATGYRRKRSQRALNDGLIALAEGNYGRAESLLSRGADEELTPAIHYIGAAEAAQAQHASDRRDNYLSMAREAMPSAEVAIGVKRAEMQIANDQPEQARATIEYLADRHPANVQVLKLQHEIYKTLNDASAEMNLLPALRRHRVFEADVLARLERDNAVKLLSRPQASIEDLRALWNGLPKATRNEVACLERYTAQLAALGFHEEAEKLLRKHLTRQWDGALVRRYGSVQIENADLQLERAESWLATRADDPDLLLSLSRLSVNADDWSKARDYLLRLTKLAPSPLAYQLLAEVYEHIDDNEAAHRCHREGLRLATNSGSGLPIVIQTAEVV